MFSKTLSPYLCQQFTYLKGETRHPDILSSYLSAILTLQLFALNHSDRSCFLYPMSSKPWIKYRTDEEYQQHVLEPNSFDLIQEVAEEAAGPAIDLRSQRKRFRPELVMINWLYKHIKKWNIFFTHPAWDIVIICLTIVHLYGLLQIWRLTNNNLLYALNLE